MVTAPLAWQTDRMSTIRGARERARIEVTAAIKDEARKQLAEQGAPKLSLRAVARELGMVSSALYRYFPSRDDLLTALIVDAFDAIGAAAEQAAAGERAEVVPPAERWVAVACAVREWALAHPRRVRPDLQLHPSPATSPRWTRWGPRRAWAWSSSTSSAARTGPAAWSSRRSRTSCAPTQRGWPP
ncbi:hypothetical protein SBADM41S_06585 [Streptomyces badius]